MPEDNSGTGATLTDTQVAAQAALQDIRSRGAAEELIAQSAIAEAGRRAAEADLAAQHAKLAGRVTVAEQSVSAGLEADRKRGGGHSHGLGNVPRRCARKVSGF
jgi:hypothetical protein